jgi:hypothetical protein
MNDYPTDEELGIISKWELWTLTDFHTLMAFIKTLWAFDSWRQFGDIYIIATSGWSGNEDIIGAMQGNQMFWMIYWTESTRGGRYIFSPCSLEAINKMDEIHPIIPPKEVKP